MRRVLPLQNQARPRDGTTHDVGPDHGIKGPPLQMRSLQSFVQKDPMTGLSETVPELNIFHLSREPHLLKTTYRFERRATNRTATGPECRRLRVTFLMDEVMEQVPILGNHSPGTRTIIVRTEDSSDIFVLFKQFYDTANCPRHHNDIRIDKENQVAPCVTYSVIARRRLSGVSPELENPHSHVGCNMGSIISRAVVHDDNFRARQGRGN